MCRDRERGHAPCDCSQGLGQGNKAQFSSCKNDSAIWRGAEHESPKVKLKNNSRVWTKRPVSRSQCVTHGFTVSGERERLRKRQREEPVLVYSTPYPLHMYVFQGGSIVSLWTTLFTLTFTSIIKRFTTIAVRES